MVTSCSTHFVYPMRCDCGTSRPSVHAKRAPHGTQPVAFYSSRTFCRVGWADYCKYSLIMRVLKKTIKKHIAISCICSTLCAQSCRSTRCFHPMWSPSALLSLPRPRSSCGCHLCGCWRRCAAWIGPAATLKIQNLHAISRHSTASLFH